MNGVLHQSLQGARYTGGEAVSEKLALYDRVRFDGNHLSSASTEAGVFAPTLLADGGDTIVGHTAHVAAALFETLQNEHIAHIFRCDLVSATFPATLRVGGPFMVVMRWM